MKQVTIFVLLFCFAFSAFSQRISKITLSNSGSFEMITIQTEDAVINLSPEGAVLGYGIEYASERIANYTRLEPFTGRIDLFTEFDDAAFRGKLKYLGKTPVTYYASYDTDILRGKVKSIGSVIINYNMQYDDEAFRGKIKSIGNTALAYFSNFDNQALRGKLKSVGFTELNYYSSFDDKAFSGKIKSIAQTVFTYYPSYDMRYAGAMKTGNYFQVINGINFNIL